MVHAFILHTLFPGSCKVLFYKIYGRSGCTSEDNEGTDSARPERGNIDYIASQVHSEFQFRRSVTNRSVEEEVQSLSQEDQLPQFELGFLRLPAEALYSEEKIVVWLGTGNTCFTLVCHKNENRTIAEHVLKILIRCTQDYLRLLNQPAEASLKGERMCLILSRFLPDGTLVFMNHRVVRSIERELELLIKT
ncbi:AP-5 complex subunit sigma-1-like [Dreissena polymorpha]|uniref:AP-5 complex subunit sigma-1 n=1 Tax=Dreissena polymorpha TaxID=45954 RepID=A0A9D4EVC6_DREPO|nr:AP-5 complex subunit sigma-1-like [Dreissena polymorpha]KAH3787330.1 hypothetical protein DPMN_165452 [Dreissena polymorpha]